MGDQPVSLKPLRIAVVGGGAAARKAISALSSLLTVQIETVLCLPDELTDLIPPSKRSLKFNDILAAGDVAAVYVATPVDTHVELAEAALAVGKNVLIEKPLATSTSSASILIPPVGIVAAMAFKKRFSGANRYVRVAVAEWPNVVVELVWRIHAPTTAWRYDSRRAGGGVIMDLGSHALDLLEHLFGEIVEILATVQAERSGVETCALLAVRFSRGHRGTIALQWGDEYLQRLSICSPAGHIVVDRSELGDDLVHESHSPFSIHRFPQNSEYIDLFTQWRDAIDGRPSAVPSLAEGIRNLRLIEAAYASVAARNPVGTL